MIKKIEKESNIKLLNYKKAKEIEKVDDLVDHIENSSVLDIIPEEYKEMMVNENGSTNKE